MKIYQSQNFEIIPQLSYATGWDGGSSHRVNFTRTNYEANVVRNCLVIADFEYKILAMGLKDGNYRLLHEEYRKITSLARLALEDGIIDVDGVETAVHRGDIYLVAGAIPVCMDVKCLGFTF